jgi:N-acetylglucosamine kinase-like BadF-type ATPase
MSYFIGIDGGGTKSTCVIADERLNVLAEFTGEPTNFLLLGTETVCVNLLSLIEECLDHAKLNYDDISATVLGTTGAGRRSDAEKMETAFVKYCAGKIIELKKFHVESDARAALEGAFSGNPGSILIAGTGSIMFGKDDRGDIHRTGGFGRFIGDEGSGYSISRKGLSAVARAFDGRGGKTLLTGMLAEQFSITTADELIIAVYRNNFEIPSAASLVLAAAEQNDPVSVRILEEESDELILHITTMADKLNVRPLNISFTGSLISHDNIFSRMLQRKIKDSSADVIIKNPDHSPAIGAVIYAKNYLAGR